VAKSCGRGDGQLPPIATLANAAGVTASDVSIKISLTFLATDIDGRDPVSLIPERFKQACPPPAVWEEQRARLLN
jgi:hypothetical protein